MKRILIFLFLAGCAGDIHNPCETGWLWDQFSYSVTPTKTTPEYGIKVDDSGHNIDLDLVDRIYGEVLDCVNKEEPPEGSITIKIPGQYVMSCPGENRQQLLLDEAPEQGCTQKGLTPSSDCKCRWRAGIQDVCTAVTTPSLYMLKDPLVKIVSGKPNIWADPELAGCASPTVPRLPECEE